MTTEEHTSGRVTVREQVSSFPVEETVPRNVEQADTERVAALKGDSGDIEVEDRRTPADPPAT